MSRQTHERTLQRVRERLEEMGDMPIFSASVNRVHLVGSDPDADAMALAVEILKDANLTTQVLKLANSPLFNHGMGKIGNLSRAVVVLGFDTVKSAVITLKLIDSFQLQHPDIDMTGMLVNAYLAGGFVRGIAARCGIKDIEQSYICGLLHNLGEIVTAYTLPEDYARIEALQRDQDSPRIEAERRVLGTTLGKLGQHIAGDWEFPQNVAQTLAETTTQHDGPARNQTELTGRVAALASQTMGLLYAERPATNRTLAELTFELSKVTGIKKEQVTESLELAFRQCCDLAQAYGLDRRHLTPRLREGGDDALDKLARQFSFYARQEVAGPDPVPASRATGADTATPASPGSDPQRLLGILFEITTLIAQRSNINTILAKVLEGIHHGAGFERGVLCLLNPDHTHYTGRLAVGDGAEALKRYFDFPLNAEGDLLAKVALGGNELFVPDIDQGSRPLPDNFRQATGARSFILGALHSKARPVGLFYADKAVSGAPITEADQRSFTQLVAQAQLALQMR